MCRPSTSRKMPRRRAACGNLLGVVSSSAAAVDRASRIIAGLSLVSILGWAVPALVMVDKGFSVRDEGSYVLSYRWWDSNPYFVSEAQLFYGPLFDALNHDIAALRVVRLVMVIASNAGFAWAFASWLERHRGHRPSRQRRTSIILLLTASGGAAYLWSPLTPGYYDLTADAALAIVALMLAALARESHPSAVNPALVGFLAVVLVLTKWSTISVVLVTQVLVVGALARRSARGAAWYTSIVVAGVLATAGLCHVFLFRLDRVVPALVQVSGFTATGNHSMGFLVRTYVASTAGLGLAALVAAVPMVAGYLVAVRFAQRGESRLAGGSILGGVITTGMFPLAVWRHGGTDPRLVMITILLAALICAVVAATGSISRRPRFGRPNAETGVLIVLLVVPVAQAAGTNVAWLYVALECLAMWVAIVLILVSRRPPARVVAFGVSTYLAVLVMMVALVSGTMTLFSPFKTTGAGADTVLVAELNGLRLAPEAARQVAALRSVLGPYVVPGTTPFLSLDELAGLTYQLGGVPVGSTWNDASADRTAGILRLACRNGDVDPARAPIVIARHAPDPKVAAALRYCGFDYPSAYQPLAVPGGPVGVQVLVPREARPETSSTSGP